MGFCNLRRTVMDTSSDIRRRRESAALRQRLRLVAEDTPSVVYGLRPHRRRAWTPMGSLLPALIWLLGMAGFLIPLMMSRTSRHPDVLRAGALIWFLIFGVLNAICVVRGSPRRRSFRRDPDR